MFFKYQIRLFTIKLLYKLMSKFNKTANVQLLVVVSWNLCRVFAGEHKQQISSGKAQ